MQKIAILGGTFNPIHNGHLHLIKRFSEKIGFDRVILIPTKVPTHKGEEHLAGCSTSCPYVPVGGKGIRLRSL